MFLKKEWNMITHELQKKQRGRKISVMNKIKIKSDNSKDKQHNKFEQKRKGTKFYNKNFGNHQRSYQGSNYKGNKHYNPCRNKDKEPIIVYNKNTSQREPFK